VDGRVWWRGAMVVLCCVIMFRFCFALCFKVVFVYYERLVMWWS